MLERAAGEPRVERQRDRAGTHRAEEEFDELGAVADQHGDPLAGSHPEPSQHAGHGIHARIELPISRTALPTAEQIEDGDFVGQARYRLIEEKPEISPTVIHPVMLNEPSTARSMVALWVCAALL